MSEECPKCLCSPCMCQVPSEVLRQAAKALEINPDCPYCAAKDEIRMIGQLLSVRPGETVVEAAKRWRETVEWYGNQNKYYPNSGRVPQIIDDVGQRARECLGSD